MICEAYLALGSNIGDRERNLAEAQERLQAISGIEILRKSGIYETEPVGYLEQDKFLNMVILISTDKNPDELLKCIQKIEGDMKRVRSIRWGPRSIDIDILLFGDFVVNTATLTIPHPRMLERAFVLIPLKDIYTEEKLGGKDIRRLAGECSDRLGVIPYKNDSRV